MEPAHEFEQSGPFDQLVLSLHGSDFQQNFETQISNSLLKTVRIEGSDSYTYQGF